MGVNLGPLNIKDTYQNLVQVSGSQLTDGSGNLISSVSVNAATATSASFATTASYALNAGATVNTGSLMVTGSATANVLTFTKGDGSTFALTVATGSAVSASYADYAALAGTANTASYVAGANVDGAVALATNALSASIAGTSGYAVLALTSSHALYAEQAGTSGFAVTASYVATASYTPTLQEVTDAGKTTTNNIIAAGYSGSYLISVGQLDLGNLSGNTNITSVNSIILSGSVDSHNGITAPSFTGSIEGTNANFTNITASSITADDATFTSASIGHLTTVTGSAVIIGDAYVVVNSSATTRYAGIKVYESGAAVPTTASLEFDSVTNDWFYEYTGSDPTNFGAVMFGPEYSTKGSPTYPTANTLTKGNGGHHLVDSSITDDGTDVVVNANISASGFVSASEFVGDLTGNADTATSASQAQTANEIPQINKTSSAFAPLAMYDGSGADYLVSDFANLTYNGGTLYVDKAGATPTIGGIVTSNISASGYVSASSFIGDGSQLSGVDAFPYTGSAIISGSLSVEGTLAITGSTAISSSTLGTGSLIDNLGQEGILTGSQVQHIVNLSQAEYDALTPDANTLYVIDGAETLGDTVISGSLIGEVNTLSDAAGTTTLDCSVGNYFTLAMPAGGTTELVPSNIQAGQTINIEITQNGTASTLTYDNTIEFPGGTAFTISTFAGAVDILTLV